MAVTAAFQRNAFQVGAFQVLQEFWVLTEIIDRFETVLEASPFTLKPTKEPFSHDRQPNGLLDNAYRIEDSGLVSSASATNEVAVRIDSLTVWIAKKLSFDGQAAMAALETQVIAIERAVKADGKANGFHVEIAGRDIRRKNDFATASIRLRVDYDFSESV
jgi:hypothetical protein